MRSKHFQCWTVRVFKTNGETYYVKTHMNAPGFIFCVLDCAYFIYKSPFVYKIRTVQHYLYVPPHKGNVQNTHSRATLRGAWQCNDRLTSNIMSKLGTIIY